MTPLLKELPCKCSDSGTHVKLDMVTSIFVMPELLCGDGGRAGDSPEACSPPILAYAVPNNKRSWSKQDGRSRGTFEVSTALLIHTVGCTYPVLTHIHT